MKPEYLKQPKKIGFLKALYILMGIVVLARIADIIGRIYMGAFERVSESPDFPLVAFIEAAMLISKIIAIRNRYRSTNYIFLIASFVIEYIWWLVWPITYGAAMEYKPTAIAATIAVAYVLTTPWLICAIRMKQYIVCRVSPWSDLKFRGLDFDDYVCEICDKNTRRLEYVKFEAENETKKLMVCPKCMWKRDLSSKRVYKLKDEDETIDLTEDFTSNSSLERESAQVMEIKLENNTLIMQDIDLVLRKKQLSKQERPTEESYGFEMNNPIYTGSKNDSMRYLTALRTEEGGSVEFEQTNTIRLDKFNGLENIVIESYAVKTPDGENTLYLCPDGFCKYIAPKGFVLSEIDYDKVYVKETVGEVKTEAVINSTVHEKTNNVDNGISEVNPVTVVSTDSKTSEKVAKVKIFFIVALLFFLLSALTLCVYLYGESNNLKKQVEEARTQNGNLFVENATLNYNNDGLKEENKTLNSEKLKLENEKADLENKKKELERENRNLKLTLPGEKQMIQDIRDFSYGTKRSTYYSDTEVMIVQVGETKSLNITCTYTTGQVAANRNNTNADGEWEKDWVNNTCTFKVTGKKEGTTVYTFSTDFNKEEFKVLIIVLSK